MIDNRFEQYWRSTLYRPKLRYTLVLSVLAHVLLATLIFGWLNLRPKPKPPEVYQIQLVQASQEVAETAPKQVVEPPTPEPTPEPMPTPPPEPPKEVTPPPEPKVEKKPEPKPVPEKPAPKPKPPEEKPKPPEPKPEPPKPEEKPKPPEKKPDPPKEKKPDPPKKVEKPPKKEEPKPPEKPKPTQLAKNQGEITQGVEEAQLPDALRGWAALVQRKVDRNWVLPAGISLGEDGETIRVGFIVASNGDLMDGPTILDGTSQSALDSSCLSAIKGALPLPPFPTGFDEPEQYVVYVFRAVP